MREWPSGKVSVTVSKFNVYSLHFLQICDVFSLTNVNVTSRGHNSADYIRQIWWEKQVLLSLGSIDPVMRQRPQLDSFQSR